MRLSIMKPLSAKWIIDTCDYLASNPSIIINGFRAAGIVDALKQRLFIIMNVMYSRSVIIATHSHHSFYCKSSV